MKFKSIPRSLILIMVALFVVVSFGFPSDLFAQDLNVITGARSGRITRIPAGYVEYSFWIHTGNYRTAGTNSNIYITFTGTDGRQTREYNVASQTDHKFGNLFERNTMTKFYLVAKDVGTIKSVTLRKDNKGIGPQWYFSRIRITKNRKQIEIRGQRWFSSRNSKQTFVVHTAKTNLKSKTFISDLARFRFNYPVRIFTGDKRGAGTDSNIYLYVEGYVADQRKVGGKLQTYRRQVKFDRIILNKLIRGNAFERGNVDRLVLRNQPHIDRITRIIVTSDNRFAGSSWYLNKISIDLPAIANYRVKRTQVFTANRWFERGKLSAVLYSR